MRSPLKFFLIWILLIVFQQSNAQSSIHKYIRKYESLAIEQMKRYNIPASVILGVSIVESGAGQSKLAKAFNNYFGVKGANQNSQKKLGYQSAYREYQSDTASYEHFCRILQKKNFYSKIKGETDYKLWLYNMNKANYSTSKDEWVRKVSAAIRKYNLDEYDEM